MLFRSWLGVFVLSLGTVQGFVASGVSAAVVPLKIIAFGDSTTTNRGGPNGGQGVTIANSCRPSTGITTVGGNTDSNVSLALDHDVVGPTGWLYTYGDILRDELGGLIGQPVDVLNEGLSGNMSHQAVARMGTDVLGRDADVVIIQFGINDSVFTNGRHNVALDAAEEATYDPFTYTRGNFIDNMTLVVQQAKAEGLRVILMTPNHAPATSVDLTALPLYAQAVRDIAGAEGVELVDVYALYDILANNTVVTDPALLAVLPGNYQSLDPADLLVADQIHPNGLGQRMVGEALKQVLVPDPAGVMVMGWLCLVAARRRR
ncbi:MAG: GDSL-type esterase/lipase family protein [Phycisphaerales bacterium]